MLIIELVLLCALFWGICYINTGSDTKNLKSYASYPDEIQKIIKENPVLSSEIKITSSLISFLSNIIIFGVVIFIFGIFIKEKSFTSNLINLSILGQSLNLFDFLVIDMLWWRNSKRIRFTGTENMAHLYKNPQKHFISFLKGILVFLIIAVIDSLLLSFI